jgi:hypothetical protein
MLMQENAAAHTRPLHPSISLGFDAAAWVLRIAIRIPPTNIDSSQPAQGG